MTWTKDKFEKLYARFTESGLSIIHSHRQAAYARFAIPTEW